MTQPTPVVVAIINDYEVVVAGVARMLEPYADRVRVVELEAGQPVQSPVDVALYDSFAQPLTEGVDRTAILRCSVATRLLVYSWKADPTVISSMSEQAVDGFVAKQTGAADLVAAIERVHAGESMVVVAAPEGSGDDTLDEVGDAPPDAASGDWPGRAEGLTARESEIVALIVQGLSNENVAARAFLSINTIKSYIRSAYRKMGVRSRSQAVLWGIDHGFRTEQRPGSAGRSEG